MAKDEDTETYFNDDMDAAPLDREILLAIKDGDSPVGYAIEKGNWDADEERWTGEWRQDCANASQSEASNWFHRSSIGIREPRR